MRIRRILLGSGVAVVCAGAGAAVVHAAAAGGGHARRATVSVTVGPMGNTVFSPAAAKARLGDTVEWTWGSSNHSSTDTTGLNQWDSGVKNAGFVFDHTFAHSGTYGYHCSVHFFLGMTGKISVPLNVNKTSATAITLTWASAAPPASFVEDVQEEAPGASTFTKLATGATALSRSLTLTSGTWKFRAHYRNTMTGKQTAWSPVSSVTIS